MKTKMGGSLSKIGVGSYGTGKRKHDDSNLTKKNVEGIGYMILSTKKIRKYVLSVCEKEWTENDFSVYGDELYKSIWKLKKISTKNIKMDNLLLERKEFQEDLKSRIKKQEKLFKSKKHIPPLILRESDMLIFDGYARLHFFKKLGINKCLAYVGYKQ